MSTLVTAATVVTAVVLGTAQPASAASWSGWGSLGNSGMGAPASAGRANGNLDVLARKGNVIYHKWWGASSGFSAWLSIGVPCPSGQAASDPGATARSTGELDVFVSCADPDQTGTDFGDVYHKWWSASNGWSGWLSIGAPGTGAMSRPAASWRTTGALDVIVLGSPGVYYNKWWSASHGWSGWGSIGAPPPPGELNRSPAAAGRSTGELDVFALGSGGNVYHKYWSGSAWSAWGSIGTVSGGFVFGPGATARPGTLDVVALNPTSRQIFHKWWSASAGWSAWGSIGGPTGGAMAAPGASVRTSGALDVLTNNGAGTPHLKWYA